MAAMVIRNLPDDVHASLRRMAADRGQSLKALVRQLLADAANEARPTGIDFERLAKRQKELGIEDWPEWTEEIDDPAFSRRVLGLED
ncbi:MAG: FitA-like ribbon-helix-helix domain-containing protein [Vitreimonas sp.]